MKRFTKKVIRFSVLLMIIVVALYVIGGLTGDQCTVIGDCRGCWSTFSKTVTSELCPSGGTCEAKPYQQQRNAIIDTVLCACQKASADGYSNTEINERIQEVILLNMGYSMPVEQICEDSSILVKVNYG